MDSHKAIAQQYRKLYVDFAFERRGLFEFIQKQYQPAELLYPGCSIHVTPAFYFPHVVFVDQSPTAVKFFANYESVLELIKQQKTYQRSPYIQFIPQDFTQPLPLLENQFDLILALYTGSVALACKSYLKVGGILVSNNHQNDAAEAAQDQELVLNAIVQKRQGKYQITQADSTMTVNIENQTGQSKRYLRQTSSGYQYIEQERYYIFKRIRLRE